MTKSTREMVAEAFRAAADAPPVPLPDELVYSLGRMLGYSIKPAPSFAEIEQMIEKYMAERSDGQSPHPR